METEQTTLTAPTGPANDTDPSTAAPKPPVVLVPAIPAPSTEATTHVIVPNDHVTFILTLAEEVVQGIQEATVLVNALRDVFGKK